MKTSELFEQHLASGLIKEDRLLTGEMVWWYGVEAMDKATLFYKLMYEVVLLNMLEDMRDV